METINLVKGQNVNLTKGTGITKVHLALAWNEGEFDVDASLFLLKGDKLKEAGDIVYFNNLVHKSGAVKHSGDNLTGAGKNDTDKEIITIDLSKIPADYNKLISYINIYKAEERKQNFGLSPNCYGRIIDEATGKELCKYLLSEDFSLFTGIIVGEFYRDPTSNNDWKFKAIGKGVNGSIETAAKLYE